MLTDTTTFAGPVNTSYIASFFNYTNGSSLFGTSAFSVFTPAPGNEVDQSVGSFLISVAVGDLNGDGILDLVVANYADGFTGYANTGGSLSVLLGNGDGTFQSQTIIVSQQTQSGLGPAQVALVDLNADGKLDIVVASNLRNEVCIYLGNGNGTFQTSTHSCSNTSGSAYAMGIADFNKDGKPDIVVTNTTSTIDYFAGNGNGTLGSSGNPTRSVTSGNGSSAIAVGDFNGDGNPDFAVTNGADGTVQVFLGDGTGNFTALTANPVGNFPNAIVTGDFNGDGKLDIAETDQDDNTVSILIGNGDGTFQGRNYMSSGGAGAITLVDVNSDGKPDLVVANTYTLDDGQGNYVSVDDGSSGDNFDTQNSATTIGVFLSNGDGTFQAMTSPITTPVGLEPYMVAVGDFNGDGVPDFAVPDASDALVATFINQVTAAATLSGSAVSSIGPVLVDSGYTHISGDPYVTSVSGTVQLQANSTPGVSSSSNPATYGNSVTFTVTVPSVAGFTPTGTVQLKNGSSNLGSALTLSGGTATYTTSGLTLGSHTIKAVYSGNTQYVSATSAGLTQVVAAATTTTLTASPSSTSYGTSVLLTATVSSSGSPVASSNVTFYNGSTSLGTANTNSSGVATLTTTTLPVGSDSITATTAASGNYLTSTLSAVTVTVAGATTTTTLTASPSSTTYGTSVLLTATVRSGGSNVIHLPSEY